MPNELRHKDAIAGRVREVEYEHINQHILNDQATGDLMYASSATQLSGLPIGSAGDFLTVTAGKPAWTNSFAVSIGFADDILFTLGTDDDIAMVNRSTSLGANTTLTGVIVGTRVTQAMAANSLLIGNITASGDIGMYVNKGGNSIQVFFADGSTGDVALLAASGQSIDHYINGGKVLDHAAGAFAFQESTTISSTGTLTINAVTLGGAVAGGDQAFTGVGNMTFTDGSILAAISTDTATLLIKAGGLSGDTVITITSLDAGDRLSLAKVYSLVAMGNLDIGAYDFRAATITADGLTSGRVVFAGTNGVLSDDSDFTFSVDTLTVTKIAAFEATGAINFASQNMTNVDIDSGTIGGVTLDGTITGGNQNITQAGRIGFANTAISTNNGLFGSYLETGPAASKVGVYVSLEATDTSSSNAQIIYSGRFIARVDATNTQNWTATPASFIGVSGQADVQASAAGTITGVASFHAPSTIAAATVTNRYGLYIEDATGAGTLTNQYGIYIADLTKGGTLDYGIYIAGADTYALYIAADGAYVVGASVFDVGSGDLNINTTGDQEGLQLNGSNATGGPGISYLQSDTTPALNSIMGNIRFSAYDHDGSPAIQSFGHYRVIHSNIGDGTEEATVQWYLMAAGAPNNLAMTLSGAGGLAVDLDNGGTDFYVSLFDKYDDALILKQGIQQNNRELLTNLGVLTRKNTGSGYMMNIQPMTRLLAGGIYQNRALIESNALREAEEILALKQKVTGLETELADLKASLD